MKKILIVEDEAVVRSIYRRKFELAGYQVETAEEGASALKMIPTFRPDIIQVDIMMPGIDGVEVIRQIRAWPEFQSLPILVVSSFYRPDLAKQAWQAGANKCVSKMDCTPNLALELIEQLLSGENTGFMRKAPNIPLSAAALEQAGGQSPPKTLAPEPPRLSVRMDPPLPRTAGMPRSEAVEPAPSRSELDSSDQPRLKVSLDLPPSRGATPTRPSFALPKDSPPARPMPSSLPSQSRSPISSAPPPPTEPPPPAKPAFFGKSMPAPFKPTTRPSFASPAPKPAEPAPATPYIGTGRSEPAASETPSSETTPSETAETTDASGPDFRIEIRKEFLRRAPQIQAELRDRIGALIRSKSTTDQLKLLHDLEDSVASLASLSGITGFSRISHLSGALDALIKDLHRKPSQMTASVLRTIAHAMDCLNVLFRELTQVPQDVPQSILILVVDDEPISRRTISVALAKANLRCVALEDSKMALTVLKENPFDLIFLDAEMPGMNGFELCGELRKLNTNKNTPVIFVTSLTKFEFRAQSSLSGGNDLIAKPFLMMELAVKALTYLLKPQLSVEAKIRPGTPPK